MPHINSDAIDDKLYQKLFKELEVLVSKTDVKSANAVLSSLLTPTEQIMLTKRFAVVLLLSKGLNSYEIWHVLKLSPSTVARIEKEYSAGVYKPLITTFKKSLAKDFFSLLEVILSAGLPPRSKDRWQHVPGFGNTK